MQPGVLGNGPVNNDDENPIRPSHQAYPNHTQISSFDIEREPTLPVIKTSIPGPKSQKAIASLNTVFDIRSLNMLGNYNDSVGNYIADIDGNLLLDV
jgi:hypothetical protein